MKLFEEFKKRYSIASGENEMVPKMLISQNLAQNFAEIWNCLQFFLPFSDVNELYWPVTFLGLADGLLG